MTLPGLPLQKVISGGQTGVDRAALDAARVSGLAIGGWCPAERRAEDGPIDPAYPLTETPEPGYEQRTMWNIREADATLVLAWGPLEGGTALTVRFLEGEDRRYRLVELDDNPDPEAVRAWLRDEAARVLNVAGPRATKAPPVYETARAFLEQVFTGSGVETG
ncbi:putative molybdenum carrier protein [Thiohalorhabdus sp.]|uniref:putative molybdenum carrier protein n=1 Tax=Thiohalorhabdus sp. TaxID=3094134 RepID=UPI002FC331C5